MSIKYAHTNIVARDWKKLSHFYQAVFACTPVPPIRKQSGQWLEKGTGLKNITIDGIHLRLPGHGENGPTLEIYQYHEIVEDALPTTSNKKGYGHLAFLVDDIKATLSNALSHGGSKLGDISQKQVPKVGLLTFIYITDPEDNIIELQHWG